MDSMLMSKFQNNTYSCNITEIISPYIEVPHDNKAYMVLVRDTDGKSDCHEFDIRVDTTRGYPLSIGTVLINRTSRTIKYIKFVELLQKSLMEHGISMDRYLNYKIDASLDWF